MSAADIRPSDMDPDRVRLVSPRHANDHERVDHNLGYHRPPENVAHRMEYLRNRARDFGHSIVAEAPAGADRDKALDALELALQHAIAGLARAVEVTGDPTMVDMNRGNRVREALARSPIYDALPPIGEGPIANAQRAIAEQLGAGLYTTNLHRGCGFGPDHDEHEYDFRGNRYACPGSGPIPVDLSPVPHIFVRATVGQATCGADGCGLPQAHTIHGSDKPVTL